MRSLRLALIQYEWCPYKKMKFWHTERNSRHTEKCISQGMTMRGHSKKAATCKPRRESAGKARPANILISGFQPPEWRTNKFLLFKLPGNNTMLFLFGTSDFSKIPFSWACYNPLCKIQHNLSYHFPSVRHLDMCVCVRERETSRLNPIFFFHFYKAYYKEHMYKKVFVFLCLGYGNVFKGDQ